MRKTILFSLTALLALAVLAAFSQITTQRAKPALANTRDFQQFLQQFKPALLPYVLSKETLLQRLKANLPQADEQKEERRRTQWRQDLVRLVDPNGFLPGHAMEMMSRVPSFYNPVARVETKEYVAVIYSVTRGFAGPYSDYQVAVFDKTGQFVSENTLAQLGTTSLTAATIYTNLLARTEQYRINWKRNLDEFGLEGNSITGVTQESANDTDLTLPTEGSKLPKIKQAPKTLPDTESIGAVDNE